MKEDPDIRIRINEANQEDSDGCCAKQYAAGREFSTSVCALGISLYLNLREDFLPEVPEFLRRTRRVR